MKVVLYTTHCPRCMTLEKMLTKKNIDFVTNDNQEEFVKLGLKSAPALKIDEDKILTFEEATEWLHKHQSY